MRNRNLERIGVALGGILETAPLHIDAIMMTGLLKGAGHQEPASTVCSLCHARPTSTSYHDRLLGMTWEDLT